MAFGALTFSKKVEIFARFCGVYALVAAFILADVISFQIPFFQDIRPSFTLMALFYWSIYRPTLTPPLFAFAVGILIDLLSGLPVGLHAVLFVMVHYLVSGQRKMFMGQPFITVFFGYCFVAAAITGVQWLLYGLVTHSWVPLMPVMGMAALGIAFFPVALLLMNASHKLLPFEHSGMSQPMRRGVGISVRNR